MIVSTEEMGEHSEIMEMGDQNSLFNDNQTVQSLAS